MIRTRKDGNRVYYSANTEHPLFPEIRSLVEKTTGVRAILQEALKALESLGTTNHPTGRAPSPGKGDEER